MATPYYSNNSDDGRDIASQFNQQYAEAGLQPSVGERATIAYDKARQFGNNTTRVTGVALRGGGKGMQRGGTKMMRAGAAMSRTGAGAIVGVPLMAAGAVVGGVGKANAAAGRKMSDKAQGTKKLLRAKGLKSAPAEIKKRIAVTRINLFILSIATPIWFSLQLPVALASLVALGIAATGKAVIEEIMKGPITSVLYSLFDGITNAIQYVTGINLNLLESWDAFGIVLLYALLGLVVLIGMFTLGLMAFMYIFSGIRCFGGQGATIKSSLFIVAMFGYFLPALNILPWFILWGIAVWRYPK